jgi:hypothetical protein
VGPRTGLDRCGKSRPRRDMKFIQMEFKIQFHSTEATFFLSFKDHSVNDFEENDFSIL